MTNVFSVGRLGKDSEIKKTGSGKDFLSFTVAVDERRKGETVTDWWNCSWYGENAIKMAQWLKKGSLIAFSGDFAGARIYQNKNNENVVSLDLMVNSVSFVSTGKGNGENNTHQTPNTGNFEPTASPQPAPAPQSAPAPATDNDLPF
jgi:single-strand binding protein